MLQRAASNAYSWWWASHVRTKQSKWLEQSLQDMGDKVEAVLKLITQDGDSFAKRAEMYYKHRPELINFIEESFREYQSLAERYDSISKELQNANSTLAAAFPDQFQYQIDDDDDFPSPRVPKKFQMEKPPDTNIPKAPAKFPTKSIKAIMALTNSKKTPFEGTPKSTSQANKVLKSGLTKSEARAEIDKLQKQILTLQTEKEFAKSSYESGHAKYWNIEEEITGMQEKISQLQDEFAISQTIDDDEARTLMAEAAIKSCQDTLAQLKEKQERGAEEAKTERQRIKDARDRLRSLKGELAHDDQTNAFETGDHLKSEETMSRFNDEVEISGESMDLEMLRDKIKDHSDVDDNNPLTVSEMAEKIDELVNKVISLEAAVSSQTALIHTLRSETDELQSHIKNLEDDKANLIEGKNDLSDKVNEMENKLRGLHELDSNFQQHNNSLETHFSEARSNLDTISKKLHDVKPDEEFEKSSQLQDKGKITNAADVKTELMQDINEKYMKPTIVNQNVDAEGTTQPKSNSESAISSKMNDSQTQIQPTLKESKLTTLVMDQAKEPFNGEVQKQVNPQEIQEQPTTQSRNQLVTAHEIHSEMAQNRKGEESVNPQGTQQCLVTVSTNEPITPQEVHSDKTAVTKAEELLHMQRSYQEHTTLSQEIQSKEIPYSEAEEPINTQGTDQRPETLPTNEHVIPQAVQSKETPNSKAAELINPQGTLQQPSTLSTNVLVIPQSKETPDSKKEELKNPHGTSQQPPTLSTNEPVVAQVAQSKQPPNNKAEELINPQGTQQQHITLPTNKQVTPQIHKISTSVAKDEPITLEDVLRMESVSESNDGSKTPSTVHRQEGQSKESPNSKAQELVNPQGTQQQHTTLPTDKKVTPQFHKIATASVAKDKPVTLEDVLRRESVSEPNDGSNTTSVHRQEQTRKDEDEPDWQQLFMNGLEGKEKVLLAEYTNTLRNYKEAKKRLGELEKKCQIDISGIDAQLRELKNYNATKDAENQSLRQKLNALQKRLDEYKNEKEAKDVDSSRNRDLLSLFEDEEDIRVIVGDGQTISPAEEKLRGDIDEILEENLDFWMRFSASFGQIQKFQNGVKDLFLELAKVEKDNEIRDESSHETGHSSLKSGIRPIYKHLREIETELTVWLEQSEKLKEESQRRFSQLCNIQEEIKHAVSVGAADDDMKFTSYNAAKFQGEVANMQQENNKVAEELQAGMDHISSLQVQVQRTITRLNAELGFYGSKSQNENLTKSRSKGKVPLRSFIFGVKPQKKKQSIFSIMQPAMMHRRYHQLKPDKSP